MVKNPLICFDAGESSQIFIERAQNVKSQSQKYEICKSYEINPKGPQRALNEE